MGLINTFLCTRLCTVSCGVNRKESISLYPSLLELEVLLEKYNIYNQGQRYKTVPKEDADNHSCMILKRETLWLESFRGLQKENEIWMESWRRDRLFEHEENRESGRKGILKAGEKGEEKMGLGPSKWLQQKIPVRKKWNINLRQGFEWAESQDRGWEDIQLVHMHNEVTRKSLFGGENKLDTHFKIQIHF